MGFDKVTPIHTELGWGGVVFLQIKKEAVLQSVLERNQPQPLRQILLIMTIAGAGNL